MSNGTARTLPEPVDVGRRAAEILAAIETDPDCQRLRRSALLYESCWATHNGYVLISNWNQDTDAPLLFDEALRVLALKTAVWELTGEDETAAELQIAAPVDEMVHAVLAQYTLCQRMTARLGIAFIHMTDRERFGWRPGDYTHQCYASAGWGGLNRRYWIDADEVAARLAILGRRYDSIGIIDFGKSHGIDFAGERAALLLAG
jgi:hypothetical protein